MELELCEDVVVARELITHLALVLHELATNARKYGALSSPGGKLSISWQRKPGTRDTLALTWQESGIAGLRPPLPTR